MFTSYTTTPSAPPYAGGVAAAVAVVAAGGHSPAAGVSGGSKMTSRQGAGLLPMSMYNSHSDSFFCFFLSRDCGVHVGK